MPDWSFLGDRLNAATGPDAALDTMIAEVFHAPPAGYTESVEDCRRLVGSALPGWELHLGFGVSGLFPYALIGKGNHRAVEAPRPRYPWPFCGPWSRRCGRSRSSP